MATYEFECCGITQEIIWSLYGTTPVPVPPCPVCNGLMKRKYSTFGISFKGDGFYSTDK